ncbi:hypothetical protein AOC05_00365 [Arthrobacter alpinus]|uniref:ABM domain-containing protein n=1 Tax=Arthrobacter alpinus TaxID=656366 RepID=A0A0M4QW89_9MICC|nr:putative quinol monooxygenase [Arthrobacter alpinus]ALE91177.1 hypothetical protein AOC05_00365 [Arthrobacter alpinus]
MSKQFYQVIAHYQAIPEKSDEVAANLAQLAEASRNEPDNLSYTVSRALDNPHHFVIIESYGSKAGFAAHRESDHFQQIGVARIIPALEDRTVTAFYGDGSLD